MELDNTILLRVTADGNGGYNCHLEIDPKMKASPALKALEDTVEKLLKGFQQCVVNKGFVLDTRGGCADLKNFISAMTIGELLNG